MNCCRREISSKITPILGERRPRSNRQTIDWQTSPRCLGENEMADKRQRTLAHTIMNESYGVGIELDADLPSMYRRLASRLKFIWRGSPARRSPGKAAPFQPTNHPTGRSALGGTV